MNALTLVLRLIHILGGVFWVGAAWMMTLYIAPSVGATGDSGLQFMRHMMGKTNLQKMLIVSSVSTVIAGTILYVRNPSAWFGSNAGIGFGIGAFFAFIGFVFGMLISRNNMAMMQLGAQIKGQPTPEQIAQLQLFQKRQRTFSTINIYALLVAVVFMAISRYLFI